MTVQESADALRLPRDLVAVADVDDYDGAAHCPLCGGVLTAAHVATPTVDADAFDAVAVDLPVYGWRCVCRRADLVIVAPIDAAPDTYATVAATIDGQRVDLAAPARVLEEVPGDA